MLLEGQRMDDLPVRTRDQLRNRVFGFIFQFYHLLPELTPAGKRPRSADDPLLGLGILEATPRVSRSGLEIIHLVGLEHRLKHKPSEISGGEMQRAAIARALVARPEILLADEPTGNLDSRTGQEITELLARLNEREQLTILMVTHDDAIAQQAHRIVRLNEGQIEAVAAAA